MCGRYAAAKAIDLVAGHFGADDVDDHVVPPGYNVAPTDTVPVVVQSAGGRRVTAMRWGLVPSWSADATSGARLINARLETLGEKPAFRTPLSRRRALIPADAYYEWLTRQGAPKQPHAIRAVDSEQLAFAGLWERWRAPAGEELLTCTIVTTASAGGIAYLHDRMPVILPARSWGEWLDTERCEASEALALLHSSGVPELVAYPVGDRVSNVRSDGADLLDEVPLRESFEQLDLLG